MASVRRRRRAAAASAVVPVFLSTSLLVLLAPPKAFVVGLEQCGDPTSVCPDRNTCCPLHNNDGIGEGGAESSAAPRWGCVPYDKHLGDGPGVCCPPPPSNVAGEEVPTGCPPGYRCAASSPDDGGGGVCRREEGTPAEGRPETLPRYVLCSLIREALGAARGFPVRPPSPPSSEATSAGAGTVADAEGGGGPRPAPELAYYSSTGQSILDPADEDDCLRAVVIIVHGSDRNADDYLCSLSSTARLQDAYGPGEVLYVAPRFLVPDDGPLEEWEPAVQGAEPLRWEEHVPIAHTWRYGADAVSSSREEERKDEEDGRPPPWGISSFEAMDRLVEHFVLDSGEGRRYPRLERVVVAGHSAGGQFAQRWALTSTSPAWGDGMVGFNGDVLEGSEAEKDRRKAQLLLENTERNGPEDRLDMASLSAVAANPRSYAYPDRRRFLPNGTLAIPPEEAIASCPGYDEWEWGLQPGGPVLAPYKDRSLATAGGREALLRRFAGRNVTYLGGTEDMLPLHGSCEDDGFQGPNRLERGRRYFVALAEHFDDKGRRKVHHRLEIAGVPHDHAFVFQSPKGVAALFGGIIT